MKIQCGTCGAEQTVLNPVAVSVQCSYCDAISLLVDKEWTSTGQKSRLSQGFSRLYRGAFCRIEGVEYHIIGRVQYSFGRGFWDEWFALTDTGQGVWITEDDHTFAVQQHLESMDITNRQGKVSIHDEVTIEGRTYRITETGSAVCLGLEGELPKEILPNEQYAYADGTSLDGDYALGIEYDDEPPTVFIGRWIHPREIEIL